MLRSHSVFEQPKDNTKIWRYMDFTKFVSLLDREALFFVRSDKLLDPYEGFYPKANDDCFGSANATQKFSEANRKETYINCWHMNDHESAAMWKVFLKSDEGIAIQSTFARLREGFNYSFPDVFAGVVRYIDHDTDSIPTSYPKIETGRIIDDSDSSINAFAPFLYKRKSFEYEQELRIIFGDLKPQKEPVYVKVNLDKLIESIYVAPAAEPWFPELVDSIVKKYKLELNVVQSKLYNKDSKLA
jgi:hypothetical protein